MITRVNHQCLGIAASRQKRLAGTNPLPFTLIELLLVIAIIAILTCMLLPALGRARGVAKEITCRSQCNGMGAAMQMYANDNDGFLTASSTIFLRQLGDYLKIGKTSTEQSNYEVWRTTIARCPSDVGPFHTGGAPAWGRYYSYGQNSCTSNLLLHKFSNPAKIAYSGDAITKRILPKDHPSGDGMTRDDGCQTAYERHSGRVNFTFLDGHVDGHSYLVEVQPYGGGTDYPVVLTW